MDLSKEFKQNERNQTKFTLMLNLNAELGELNFCFKEKIFIACVFFFIVKQGFASGYFAKGSV